MTNKIARIAVSNSDLERDLDRLLSSLNYDIYTHDSGLSLMSSVKVKDTSLVISEVSTSKLSGFEVCRRMREKEFTRDIPFIMLSRDHTDEEQALTLGANAFVCVPYSDKEIVDAVERLTQKRKRVLLVDDSKLIQKRTGSFLRDSGFEVMEAYNGVQGLEKARTRLPDIIISDIEMPEMDGFQMCTALKSADETALIPIVMVSSLDSGMDIEKGFAAGANDYLVKPVIHNELLSCINSLLGKMDHRREETILVVDDCKTVTNMLKFGLMQHGFKVEVCNVGEEAYEKAIEISPDVIITDIEMPGLDGIQLIKYLKELPEMRNIPVIIISSRESLGRAAKEMRIAASAFISKPFTMEKILANVERITAERRLMRERQAMKLYLSDAALDVVTHASMKKNSMNELKANEKNLTIFFTDIVGFTPFCEKHPPVVVVSMLNKYLDALTNVLIKHGGIIDKFIGDSIMAIFSHTSGADIPQLRAARTALEILETQKTFNIDSPEKFRCRIGINTGRVVFGDIGSKYYRRDFTVVGDAVNVASRLESSADPDTVLVSESVYEKIAEKVIAVEKGLIELKGKNEKIRSFQILEILDNKQGRNSEIQAHPAKEQ